MWSVAPRFLFAVSYTVCIMEFLTQIARVFPPPRYLTLPNVAVDISETAIKYISLEPKGKTYTLGVWGTVPVPEGVVSRGAVTDEKRLAGLLRDIRKKTGFSYVRLSLPEEQAYLFETSIKKDTREEDIRSTLEFKLEENVPLSPKDAFFDYDITDDREGDACHVGVSVYTRAVVEAYHRACRAAGLIPISFEVESRAIARSVIPTGDASTHMIVDFGKTRTSVGIIQNGVLMYTSTIDIGSLQLDEAIRTHLNEELSDEEMVERKNLYGLTKTGGEEDIYSAMLGTISALKDELQTRIGYWQTHSLHDHKRDIDSIILCGGNANIAGIADYFTEELGIESKQAQVWQNVLDFDEEIPEITRQHSYGYATAIGLALRNYIPV